MAKLSVSLEDRDVDVLDRFVEAHPGASRSLALREAIELLRERELAAQYAGAFDEWAAGDDGAAWDATAGDGTA